MRYLERIERTAAAAQEAGLDAVLVPPSPDLRYLAGYDPPPLERLTVLVIPAGGRAPVLVVPALEHPRARSSPVGDALELRAWRDEDGPSDLVAGLLSSAGDVAVGDRMWASHVLEIERVCPRVRLIAASRALPDLRAVKEPDELELLGRAARGADEAFDEILEFGLEGRTEAAVSERLGALLREHGHAEVNFTMVGSGPNGASPHHDPTTRRIAAGESVVLDFGGSVGGYCSDLTRTVTVRRTPPEVRDVHEVVRRAQEAAYRTARPGVAAEDVDLAAREVIESAGFGDAFFHRTGHGIGLEEHEPPYIVRGNERRLVPGMCFSIEPGIYLGGRFGVRIEDIVAVTEDGAVRLNNARRELVEVL
jgi:D-alanyl-D-alanine dipeptidase